ncbi:hypothetical protein Lal_00025172 [Lupinus albus]|nr:hypothetical protein Lal_00025172 [Lupinus albus]
MNSAISSLKDFNITRNLPSTDIWRTRTLCQQRYTLFTIHCIKVDQSSDQQLKLLSIEKNRIKKLNWKEERPEEQKSVLWSHPQERNLWFFHSFRALYDLLHYLLKESLYFCTED